MIEWEREVDEALGFEPPAGRGEVDYRALGRPPLSGTWRGWYLQPAASFTRGPMEMRVDVRGQELVGEGTDRVGRFTFGGMLDPTNGEARLRKHYVGMHSLLYVGVMHGGILRGIWTFPRGDARGVFLLGHEELVPRAKESVLGAVPAFVALCFAPFRLPTIMRHRKLADRFLEAHPDLRAWLA